MHKLSENQKRFLWDACSRYREALPGSPAAEFLESRGLTLEEVRPFGLGYVVDPLPGHERYRDMLAIPYLRRSAANKWSAVAIRFRCLIPECDHKSHPGGKYVSMPGDGPMLYNPVALLENEDTIAICEGELDAITATVSGVPAVGIAGAETWQPHYTQLFDGYEEVRILADGDSAGDRLAEKIAGLLPNAKIFSSSPGGDVNSDALEFGREYLRKRVET